MRVNERPLCHLMIVLPFRSEKLVKEGRELLILHLYSVRVSKTVIMPVRICTQG